MYIPKPWVNVLICIWIVSRMVCPSPSPITIHTLTWVHLSRDWSHLHVIGSSSPSTIKSNTSQHCMSDLVAVKWTHHQHSLRSTNRQPRILNPIPRAPGKAIIFSVTTPSLQLSPLSVSTHHTLLCYLIKKTFVCTYPLCEICICDK